MSDADHGHTVDTDEETPGETVDTHRGHTVDTEVTGHRGHGQVGLVTHRPPVSGSESLLEALGYHRPSWQKDALCREYPEITFFPERGQPAGPALQVCGNCIVREECLAWALADPDLDNGVMGGMTSRARTQARKLQQRREHQQ